MPGPAQPQHYSNYRGVAPPTDKLAKKKKKANGGDTIMILGLRVYTAMSGLIAVFILSQYGIPWIGAVIGTIIQIVLIRFWIWRALTTAALAFGIVEILLGGQYPSALIIGLVFESTLLVSYALSLSRREL
jgi:hypothetical protein